MEARAETGLGRIWVPAYGLVMAQVCLGAENLTRVRPPSRSQAKPEIDVIKSGERRVVLRDSRSTIVAA